MTNLLNNLKKVIVTMMVAITGSHAQQVVINTNPGGIGSLAAAITNALGTGGAQTIRFNIPGAPPYIISTGTLDPAFNIATLTATSLLINANTQPGWVPGKPVVILRGNGGGDCFKISRSNITIKGLIIQNYNNGYHQLSGINNAIEGCWFGLDFVGTTLYSGGLIKQYGVLVETNAGNNTVSIGNKTIFSDSTRNIISGSGTSGILFLNAGAGSYVGNTYVGTDASGTQPLGNGTGSTVTEVQHGITIKNTPTVTIKNNVISANKSGGIDVSMNGSAGLTITGNKIGTDFTGTKPLGNRTFGIRIKDSGGHTIGGVGTVNRNIISANGSNDYQHEQNTSNPLKFDWYNSCGIYLYNSGNNTVAGNYIGVDSTGTTYTISSQYDMGNFYVGLKIDGASANNKVGLVGAGNIIGGNGYRSSIAATAAGLINLDGHGMIIKDQTTTNTIIVSNRVGVGADGNSKIGNKQDGVSIQGSAGTLVGGATPAERNIIGDNTWGIFIASNYNNSQSSGVKIYGNYIGTNATGTAEVGNGTRADNTSGGGIGVIHNTVGTLIGGATSGQGNVISGNRIGVSVLGNSPIAPVGSSVTTSKVYGNFVGLGANGTDIIPNTENGIYFSQAANNNDIGGLLAGQANKIVGNGTNGLYSDGATANNIVGNTISANAGSGIILTGGSNLYHIFGNTIGDLTDATKANKGDGISISASSSTFIGGVNTGEGNIIANNIGNAIAISGATSINNSIHRNQIACNGFRGIELNGVANGNYAKPTFSGTPTAIIVTGPAGSYIELFSLDGCNDCAVPTNNKLQGRTLVVSGNSPLKYAGIAGTLYTATASAANATAAHNTSEFSDCYSLCVPPATNLVVKGDTVCAGTNGSVTITGAEAISYQAYIGTTAVGPVATGTGSGSLILSVLATNLVSGSNQIIIKATPNGGGCTSTPLTNTATILQNPALLTNLVVGGDTVCAGTDGSATIFGTQSNVRYQAFKGVVVVGQPLVGTGTGNTVLTIPSASLVSGANQIKFTATPIGKGCTSTPLTNTATILQNPALLTNLVVGGDTVCAGTDGSATIFGTQSNVRYQAFKGVVAVGQPIVGTGTGNTVLTIPTASLVSGANQIKFTATPIGKGCTSTPLTNTATILQNPVLLTNLVVGGDTVCAGTDGSATIFGTQSNVRYQAFKGVVVVGQPLVGTGTGNTVLTIPSASLVSGANQIKFTATPIGKGCTSTPLTNTATILQNPALLTNLVVGGDTVCAGTDGSATIFGTQSNVRYQAFKGVVAVGQPIVGTGTGNTVLTIPTASLVSGANQITFTATPIGKGCSPTPLANTATIIYNTPPKTDSDISTNSPICFGVQGILKVHTAEEGKYYQVFDESGNAVSALVLSPVNDTLKISLNSIVIGSHTLTVKASVPGCNGTFILTKTAPFVVNKGLDGALSLSHNGPICLGVQATVTILKSEIGVGYQAFDDKDNSILSVVVIGDGKDKMINLYPLAAGSHVVYFKATIGGCGEVRLGNTATIIVNTDVKTNLTATVDGPICIGNRANVTVVKAESGKTYQVFYNGKSLSAPVLGKDSNLIILVNSQSLPKGIYGLAIGVSVPGCNSDTLTSRPQLTINASPDGSLLVSAVTSPICVNTDGIVRITGVEPNVSYQAFISSNSVSSNLSGSGSNIDLSILSSNLSIGLNNISVKATIAGCASVDLADTAGIKVNPNPKLDLALSVDPAVICKGGSSVLTIATSELGVTYQAVLGTQTVSNAVIGDGGKVKLALTGLPEGANIIGVKASVRGCSDKNMDNTVTVIVNKGAKIDYTVAGNTVCKGEGGKVTISGSEVGTSYEAFNKLTNTSLSGVVAGTGNPIVIELTPSANPIDTIIIKANVLGCGLVKLDNEAIVVTNDLMTSKSLSTMGDTICKNDANATATILMAKKGIQYQATVGNNQLPTILTGNDVDLVFTVPSGSLVLGVNSVSFTAAVAGCVSVKLDSMATIIVNDNNTSKDLATEGSTICVNDQRATATIKLAKKGISYQASANGILLSDILVGSDTSLVFTIPRDKLVSGTNTVTFSAAIAGCSPVTLANSANIIVNDNSTSKSLSAEGSTVCASELIATARIKSAKNGITYQAYVGTSMVGASLVGNGIADLNFDLPTTQLSSGKNIISFIATVAGCAPLKLDSTAIVYILGDRYPISGSSLRCYNTQGTYSIDAIPGIVSYNWTVPDGDTITFGQGTNSIKVAFGNKSGNITVTPVGNIGACNGVENSLPVSLKSPFNDTLNFRGMDTVCINDKARIHIDSLGAIGVDYIDWTWSSGIVLLDTINKKSAFPSYDIEYRETGNQFIIAKPHVLCTGAFAKSDTLKVRVLAYPIVEAGQYPEIENDLGIIPLNGSGSSLNGVHPFDSLTYMWTVLDRSMQITNPNTLNGASLQIKEGESIVYLVIKNHNRCVVQDSAVISATVKVIIPNVFSPNGDGTHDKWEIKNLHSLYPNATVEVINKWGSVVFKSTGYANPWDGTRNGEEMPVATYYYIVDFKNGTKPDVRSVTIIR